MDWLALLAAVVAGSLTTAFGWLLSERSARARQWNIDKKRLYSAYLAATHQVTKLLKGDSSLHGPDSMESARGRKDLDEAHGTMRDLFEELVLMAPTPVLDAGKQLLDAVTTLIDGGGDSRSVEGTLSGLITDFEYAARRDLGIRR